MDRRELIRQFIKLQLKELTSPSAVPRETIKRAKATFFIERHRNAIGVPRDREIAYEAVDYLFDTSQITDENSLSKVLGLPFFSQNLNNPAVFFERISIKKAPAAIDFRRLREEEYRKSLTSEIRKQIIEEQSEDIAEAMRQKVEAYEALPSILDHADFEEPEAQSDVQLENQFLPWWKRLNLRDDPFPSQEGLRKIGDDLWDRVTIKTQLFAKYTHYAKNERGELFKDTLFLGNYGSGKTTLFDYLTKPLIGSKAYPLYIQVLIEPDFPSFFVRFRIALLEALNRLYLLLSGTRLQHGASDLERETMEAFVRISQEFHPSGFVVFIDDLHKYKTPEEFEIVKKFLRDLQIFKGILVRGLGPLEIAFYISGLPVWEQVIAADPMYEGSYARRESMPPITEDAAHEMLNRRLNAFSKNPEGSTSGGGFPIEYVQKIYRGLKHSGQEITYRSFIRSALSEFEKGNFTILQADPVHISDEVLASIRARLESDPEIRTRMQSVIFGGGIQREENRTRCLEALVECYLNRGLRDTHPYVKGNGFYLQRLAKARLIEKAPDEGHFVWLICRPLFERNKQIVKEFNLSLEDYLLKTYRVASIKPKKGVIFHQDLADIDTLMSRVSDATKELLRHAKATHAQLLDLIDRAVANSAPEDVIRLCTDSLCDLTNCLLIYHGQQRRVESLASLDEFWFSFWFQPSDMCEFLNLVRAQGTHTERVWYISNQYRDAFSTLLEFIRDQIDKSKTFIVPFTDLTNKEIEDLHKVRDLWVDKRFFPLVDLLTKGVEQKLRGFLFNLYRLRFGEAVEGRIAHLDSGTRAYILKNLAGREARNVPVGQNEFEQVNRGNYKNFLVGVFGDAIGKRNWETMFKHVFAPMSETEVRDFLSSFAEFNIDTSHQKEGSLNAEQQSRIYAYILQVIRVSQSLNKAYLALLTRYMHAEPTGGTPRFHYFASFVGNADRSELAPIIIERQKLGRVSTQFESQGLFTVDLADPEYIENLYHIPYPEFVAFLSRILRQTPEEAKQSRMTFTFLNAQGSVVKIGIGHLEE
jgi:hypothetical protein